MRAQCGSENKSKCACAIEELRDYKYILVYTHIHESTCAWREHTNTKGNHKRLAGKEELSS